MNFRFEFEIKKLPWPIDHRHKILLIGSCFTENITAYLKRLKYAAEENPHGILFNPVSVCQAIDDYIQNRRYAGDDLFQLNEGWHSWNHHSRFSALTSEEALKKINDSIEHAHHYLSKADYLFITFGSAWVYQLTGKANGRAGATVANNHKAPADWFTRRLLGTGELIDHLDKTLESLWNFNSKLKIIFTISPVRHIREGIINNNRSKAVLIQAVHELAEKYEQLYYFPSYELVLDDLRDYRFYAEDLVHPNYFATQYVWEKFQTACMSEAAKKLSTAIEDVNLAFQHKAFNSTSQQHRNFLSKYLQIVKELSDKYPYLDFSREIAYFSTGNQ